MRIKNAINWAKGVKSSFVNRNEVVEFWLDGFNGDGKESEEGMKRAFSHIVKIYDKILHMDPNWHYFYEGGYSLIRCSYKFAQSVIKYFRDNSIKFQFKSKWTESLYVTHEYQEIFKQMLHTFSVLTIEMYKNGDDRCLIQAADRVCHCYHNHSLYLANAVGKLNNYRKNHESIMKWEADQMAALTAERCYYNGRYQGERDMQARYKSREGEKNGDSQSSGGNS